MGCFIARYGKLESMENLGSQELRSVVTEVAGEAVNSELWLTGVSLLWCLLKDMGG